MLLSAYWMIGVRFWWLKPWYFYLFGMYKRLWVLCKHSGTKGDCSGGFNQFSVVVSLVMVILLWPEYFPHTLVNFHYRLVLTLIFGRRNPFRVRVMQTARFNFLKLQKKKQQTSLLIIGAGDAGAMAVSRIGKKPGIKLIPVGFLDDNWPSCANRFHGIPVWVHYGYRASLLKTKKNWWSDYCHSSAGGKVIRLVRWCRLKGIPFRTMPGIYEW